MKCLALAGIVLVMAALAGCSKKTPPEASYDPNMDAPPSMLASNDNPSLLADQTAISKAAVEKPAEPAPASGPAVSPTPATGPAATSPASTGPAEAAPTTAPAPPATAPK